MNYYEQELAKIDFTGPTPATILVGSEGRVTKTLNLNAECAAALIAKLVKAFILRPAASTDLTPANAAKPAVPRYLAQIGRDANGNKVVRVLPPVTGRGFTIQTNGNLPDTDRNGITDVTYREIQDYVARYGTHRQRQIVLGVV